MSQEIFIEDFVNRSDEIATRNSWVNYPINELEIIDLNLCFSEQEFDKLIRGFIPCQMEDKWFVFYENEWLYCHRSWTGYGIFKTKIVKENNYYLIKELLVEKNFNTPESCKEIFNSIIHNKLLRDLKND